MSVLKKISVRLNLFVFGSYCSQSSQVRKKTSDSELSRSRVWWREETGREGRAGIDGSFQSRIAVRSERKLQTRSFREVEWGGWSRRVGVDRGAGVDGSFQSRIAVRPKRKLQTQSFLEVG